MESMTTKGDPKDLNDLSESREAIILRAEAIIVSGFTHIRELLWADRSKDALWLADAAHNMPGLVKLARQQPEKIQWDVFQKDIAEIERFTMEMFR